MCSLPLFVSGKAGKSLIRRGNASVTLGWHSDVGTAGIGNGVDVGSKGRFSVDGI